MRQDLFGYLYEGKLEGNIYYSQLWHSLSEEEYASFLKTLANIGSGYKSINANVEYWQEPSL